MNLKETFCVRKKEIKVKIIGQELYVQAHNVKKPNNG